jgi:PAS domain S-box-containing protein
MRNLSLVQQFSLILFIMLFFVGIFFGKLLTGAMKRDMLNRSNDIIAGFIRHEIDTNFHSPTFVNPDAWTDYEAISRQVSSLNLGPDIQRIKIWNREKIIVWSSKKEEVGQQNPDDHELEEVFSGTVISEIVSQEQVKEKYAYEIDQDVMELYIPVRSGSSDEVVVVFELYKNIGKLLASISRHNRIVWLATFAVTVTLYLVLFAMVWKASRRMDWQSRQIGLSEERFRSLIHSAQDGIVSADTKGRIVLMNRAAEKIFGYSASEVDTILFSDLFGPETSEEIKAQLAQCFTFGESAVLNRSFETEGRHKNGELLSLEVSLSVSGEGSDHILTGLFRDISQRKILMEQIASAKNAWEETFDTINDAITIHDSDFNIIRANRAAEKILGLSLDNILQQKCFLSYHGTQDPPAACPSCMTARSGKESVTQMYEPNLDKYIEIKALPRFNKQRELIGVVHVVRDITSQKKAEERHEKLQAQLNQVQKMESVGKLAGGIAHDFNNMLSAIIGYSEIILMSQPEDSRLREDIEAIKDSGEKAAALTRQLLAFSRKQVLEVQPLDLNSVVKGMVKMLARVIGEDITLELHLEPGNSRVVADRSQLEQVLLNLGVNARDAMPNGGHLMIETSVVELDNDFVDQHAEAQAGEHILLAVTDTGTGMPEEVRQKIFEPFFTTKEVGKGTGLGLSTVYGVVKQHGGQIYVYSEPGKGTTFKIFLPASQSKGVEQEKQQGEAIPAGEETVLLAEDDATTRRMIKTTMEAEGYTLLEAGDGQEALEVSNSYEGDIHLLLTDVIMPKMNGQELANSLQQSRPEMEVIFMSGYTDDAIFRHGVLEPGVHFIQKPITPSILAKKLREVLKKS